MSLVKEKYMRLAPQAHYLYDEVVLALAWKKANAYVRRHNWYTDVLELDCTAADLDANLNKWSSELSGGDYIPRPARLVPAPKNGRWAFHSELPMGWAPVNPMNPSTPEPIFLRPLAHLGIREQTVSTAVMLCLANCIETAQGNPAVEPGDALSQGVYSYGNRLYCQWDSETREASFSWGSADSYSRYYQDYQQFVKRPRYVAAELDKKLGSNGVDIYIAKLDLSGFFDNIDLDRLLVSMRSEYQRYLKKFEGNTLGDDEFWALAKCALSNSWSQEDADWAFLIKGGKLPAGLPQGLLSSGFFANAYLLPFDRAMGKSCNREAVISSGKVAVSVHDYCRYVDDFRLVISVDDYLSEEQIKSFVSEWCQTMLDRSLGITASDAKGRLLLNPSKTEIEAVSNIAGATNVSVRMKQMQQQLSGPFDLSSLEQLETGLNGLLAMAEEASNTAANHGSDTGLALAHVASQPLDVRDDTLTRFAAYRLCKSLRQRRLLMDLQEEKDGRIVGEVLQQDYELTARRLVSAWAENPSLVQVLRYAFDLFPGPQLLKSVLDALAMKREDASNYPDQAAVAWYVTAELFRAAATETGRGSSTEGDFVAGDLEAFREDIAEHAMQSLKDRYIPWYVRQQAALLLACMGKVTRHLGTSSELLLYRGLHSYLNGDVLEGQHTFNDVVTTAIVGYQLTGNAKNFVKWFRKFAVKYGKKAAKNGLTVIYHGCPALFDKVTVPGKGSHGLETGLLSQELSAHVDARWLTMGEPLPLGKWISLAHVLTHRSRPFQQENALIHLGTALSGLSENVWYQDEVRSPFDLQVKCTDWDALNDPRLNTLELKKVRKASLKSDLYRTPQWCQPELGWMYAIGRILRSAAIGNNDFTLSASLAELAPNWYRGLTSTSQKRRLGMMHTSQVLGGTPSAITPWFSSLLGALLRWPGVNFDVKPHDVALVKTLSALHEIFEGRRVHQSILYGKSSEVPIYRYPVDWVVRQSGVLRVAIVQGLLPNTSDFGSPGLAGMDSAPYRPQHRNHTAALLKLASKKLSTYASSRCGPHKSEVDLVLLSEYAVHVDDQDLLRAFSDETGAMLHYGLLGACDPLTKQPTNASRWLIPVRTKRRRSWIEVDQGKKHLTSDEISMGITAWCPYRVVIELNSPGVNGFRMAGAICYDATDLALAADLKDETHMFLVLAMNKDVKTFDSMVSALRYHMYQHVVIANSGEFGGSTAQAPYSEEHKRLVSHAHGSNQISVSVFDIDVGHFGPALEADLDVKPRVGKTKPAGLNRRS